MRINPLLPLACAAFVLSLGACKKEPSGPKTAEEVKAEAANIAKPQPGKYRATVKLTDISMPGMNPAMAERMKTMFSSTGRDTEFCLTPEMAGKGFEEFAKHAAQGNCKYDSFSASAGKMDAVLTCQGAGGATMHSELHGTFTTTGSTMTMTTDSTRAGAPGTMHMVAQVTNERIGDCT